MTDLAASLSALRERSQAAVNQVNILGGEPLLHEKLPEIVRLVHDCFPVAVRFVVSNMLLFGLRKDKLLPVMKETDTWFGYSAYNRLRERCHPLGWRMKAVNSLFISLSIFNHHSTLIFNVFGQS